MGSCPSQDVEAFEGYAVGGRAEMGVPDEWNALSHAVIGACLDVHSGLGPGLPERFYEVALTREFVARSIPFARQSVVPVAYKGEALGDVRLDLVVGGLLVLELKSVDAVAPLHLAQLVTYLRVADLPLGLLVNFNTLHLRDGIFRRANAKAIQARARR